MDLSDLGEFGFLERMRSWVPASSAVVGVGDDAAVARIGEGSALVATADALVEGTHFRLDWSSPADVGHKAVSVNVSDLAAMGAEPRWLLVVLGAPPTTSEDTLRGIYEGLTEACGTYAIELIGGDTVRMPSLTLAVTALGEIEGDPLRRSGAKVGDVLAVTGPLGRAAAGLSLLSSEGLGESPGEDALACIDAHRRPRARVDAGRALRAAGVHAAMDLSDGLASDAHRLAEASGVGIEIDAALIPVAPEVVRLADARGWDARRIARAGGEDFELLVALPRDQLESAGIELIEIGRVVAEGVWLVREDIREKLETAGWDHFR